MKYKRAHNVNGTSFKGTVLTSYNKLVETFGPPCFDGKGDKVHVVWDLLFEDEFEDDVVATIYDWKLSESPYTGDYDWHIGGYNSEAVAKVQKALGL